MRRLRTVLLQDLAVLQPRFPSLPFFAYPPFSGPDWGAFALAVRSDVAASEPPSLLLQRALPEISAAFESSRDAVLRNSGRLIGDLERRLDTQLKSLDTRLNSVQDSLGALIQGRVPIPLRGYLGGPDALGALGGPVTLVTPAAAAPAEPSPTVFQTLTKAYTVQDVWRDWKEGVAGRPAVRELEERWGSRWRPGGTIRVQFCRRKVIWDELLTRIARGQSEDEAVAELERLREGRSLNQLIDSLKLRRRRSRKPATAAQNIS
ncbi:hypothetical protein N657DRAFT_626024 [Parathielavia appendiculata]|uniref:Transcription activator GCR1-like domain-containing protein n=1 Tax=Parathielavia appendiculata TaxID=2587402 RepID=A0AAN6TTC5_9PEZI|nr:hypothetical protein N657DRAFT_626024 [Parathielavia appendiculata]